MSIPNPLISRRRFTQGVAGSALAASFAGVTLPIADVVTAQDGSTQVIIGAWSEPDSLLSGAPHSGAAYQQIQRIIANGLVRLGYPSFDVEPDLAESWDVSEDSTVYTFHLRDGVTWQDGEPFTVEDVKFTLDVVTSPDWPGALDSYWSQVVGATEHKAGEATELTGARIIDDSTIEVTLLQPDTLFLASAVSRQRILPKHLIDGTTIADIQKSDFARVPTYTGAFQVTEWLPGESITLVANPNYWEGKPGIDTIISRFIPDAATSIAELSTGGLDIGTVQPDQLAQFSSDSTFTVQELPGLRIAYIQFDLTKELFTDPRIRKAISHAIDRQTVIDTLYLGYGEPGRSFIPTISWVYNPDAPTYPYDPDQAAALLEEAGWTLGDDGIRVNADGQRLAFELIAPTSSRTDGLAIQPFLQAIGIEVTLVEQGAGQTTGPLEVGQYDASISQWNNYIIDPRADLQRTFQNPRPTDSTGYANPDVDALFLEARAALDRDTEQGLWFELQDLVETDAPLVYLWRQQDLLVVGNRLTVPEVSSLSELYARIPEWQINS